MLKFVYTCLIVMLYTYYSKSFSTSSRSGLVLIGQKINSLVAISILNITEGALNEV